MRRPPPPLTAARAGAPESRAATGTAAPPARSLRAWSANSLSAFSFWAFSLMAISLATLERISTAGSAVQGGSLMGQNQFAGFHLLIAQAKQAKSPSPGPPWQVHQPAGSEHMDKGLLPLIDQSILAPTRLSSCLSVAWLPQAACTGAVLPWQHELQAAPSQMLQILPNLATAQHIAMDNIPATDNPERHGSSQALYCKSCDTSCLPNRHTAPLLLLHQHSTTA